MPKYFIETKEYDENFDLNIDDGSSIFQVQEAEDRTGPISISKFMGGYISNDCFDSVKGNVNGSPIHFCVKCHIKQIWREDD